MAIAKQRCPKCGGAITERRDQYGAYQQCLHCGAGIVKPPWAGLTQQRRTNPFAKEAKERAARQMKRIQYELF